MKNPINRTFAGILTIVALSAAAGCSDDEPATDAGTQPPATGSPTTESPTTPVPPTTSQPTATSSSATLDEPTAEAVPPLFDGNPEVAPGTYVADGFGVPFEITIAEEGWVEFDGFALVKADEGFVSFWSPTHVPGDACGWQATNREVGPAVDDFVASLVAQQSMATDEPIPLERDGYSGIELQRRVEPGTDISGCDQQLVCGWADNTDCNRFYATDAETESVLVMDLDGERAVMIAGSFAAPSVELERELAAILDSIHFVPIS